MQEVVELSTLLENFLLENKNVSINALSMRMGVAETTLRRVRSGNLKRLPNNDNLLKIIFYLFKSTDLGVIKNLLPPGLKNFFVREYVIVENSINNPVTVIDPSIIDSQITYLVLKLASNHSGVKKEEVLRLFGELGLMSAKHLEREDIVYEEENIFKCKLSAFRLDDNSFIRNFKTTAEFITTEPEKRIGPNLYHNLSESLNLEGLTRIQEIQKKAVKEICEILNDEKFKGELPVFALVAVDTLN